MPGPYDTECAGGSDNNYDFNYIDGQITLRKKTIDVTVLSHNLTYGDAKPTITCSYDATDFENGENGSVIDTAPTGSTVYTASSGVPVRTTPSVPAVPTTTTTSTTSTARSTWRRRRST